MPGARLVSTPVTVEDSLEGINEAFYEKGWTDGLPIVPPTEGRIRRIADYVRRDPSEVVALVPPAGGEATIEKIAINAVMAGCLPEYMPVLVAAVEAMAEPRFNLNGIQATTNPVAPLTIINGPIRKELDINCGSNALGQGWRANATIGRAVRLVLVNIGGGLPGAVDKATLGMPGKYTFCLGENEEESPWEPLHVERGLSRETSAVTVVGASGTSNVAASYLNARVLLSCIASAMAFLGSNNWPYGGEPLVIFCPSHAAILAKEGYTKEKIKLALYERTLRPVSDFEPEYLDKLLRRGKKVVDGRVPLVFRPEDIMVVVAGGPGGIHSTVLATFGETWAVTRPVARPI